VTIDRRATRTTNDDSIASERSAMKWRRVVGWACAAAGLAVGAGAWLAFRTPSWWSPPSARPGAVSREDDRARALEQGIAAELTKVRPSGQRFAMRIRAEDANAWLALRLPQWLVHDRELPWPKGVELVQVHAGAPDRLTLAAKRDGVIWSISVRAVIENGRLRLEPRGGAIGRLWIPWLGNGGRDDGRGALGIAALVPELAAPTDAILPLPDGRRLRLLDLEFDGDEARFQFESMPR